MANGNVNLDAMIPREDFLIEEASTPDMGRPGTELYLHSLTDDGRLATYRKPDFQRETAAWKPEIVAAFIKSVVDGDVIPSVILWKSPNSGKVFVIDGAHRLSALIAWLRDDYGDRGHSNEFFGFIDDPSRQTAATATRKILDQEGGVGNYKQLKSYARSPDSAPNDVQLKRSMRIRYYKDRSNDHKTRLEEGGTSSLDNFQFTHPYCNTGYKERKAQDAAKSA
jgi:hypothetical protein